MSPARRFWFNAYWTALTAEPVEPLERRTTSFDHVAGATIPFAVWPTRPWKALTADWVALPNTPSAASEYP